VKMVIILSLTLLSLLAPNQISCMEKDEKQVSAEKKDQRSSDEKEQSREKSPAELMGEFDLLLQKRAPLEAFRQFFTAHPSAKNIQSTKEDCNGCTPLMRALKEPSESINLDLIKLLIEPDADVNLRNEEGDTALIIATRWRLNKVIEALLKAPGLKINIRNNNGNTALLIAAKTYRLPNVPIHPKNKNQDLDLIKLLLRHDANRNFLSKNESAIDIIRKKGYNDGDPIIKILKPLPPELIKAVGLNEQSKIKEYLDKGGYIDATTDAGSTLLMWATDLGKHNLMQLLVEYGTDKIQPDDLLNPDQYFEHNIAHIDAQDNAGFTAMHIAVRKNDIKAAKILMQGRRTGRGAGLLIQANNGHTPLSLAILIGNAEMVAHILLGLFNPKDPLVQEALSTKPTQNAEQIQKVIQDFKEEKLLDIVMAAEQQKEDKKN